MRIAAYVGAFVAVAGGTGCGYSAATNTPKVNEAWVIVHNDSELPVEVFLWDGWARATRLGAMSGSDTTHFAVPEAVLAAAGPYYLEARSAQGGLYPTRSESFSLRPGYRITWAIPAADAVGAARDDADDIPAPSPDDSAGVSPAPPPPPGP